MSDVETVKSFIEAWNSRDLDRIVSLLAEDVIYHNIPLEPMRGRAQLEPVFEALIDSCSTIDWRLHQIGDCGGGVVLTERTDAFVQGDKPLSIRVMGAFELKNGLIVAWRDYFDLKQWQGQLEPTQDVGS